MGFGTVLDESQRLFLVVLHVLTDLSWTDIARAYGVQFPPSRPSTGDCRTQWCRRLQNTTTSQPLEDGQLLPIAQDAQARAYLQAHGMRHLNALGQAYLGAPAPQAGPAATTTTTTTTASTSTSISAPPALSPPVTSGIQAPTLPQLAVPAPITTAQLPTELQASSDTTTTQSTADFALWLSYPAHQEQSQSQRQSQSQWEGTDVSQDAFCCHGYLYPEETGEEQPLDEETAFGAGPYGGYYYPSP